MHRLLLITLALGAPLFAAEPRPASAIPIPLTGGQKVNLRQYRGKVVIMAIVSTTCEDCVNTLQMLNRVQKDLGPQGLQVVAGAGDDNAQYLVGPLADRYKLSFPVGYLNKDQMIAIADIANGKRPVAPILMFIDKAGTVRFQYYGDHPFFKTAEGSTRSIVQGLLGEKK
jgi:peroxiredoxin